MQSSSGFIVFLFSFGARDEGGGGSQAFPRDDLDQESAVLALLTFVAGRDSRHLHELVGIDSDVIDHFLFADFDPFVGVTTGWKFVFLLFGDVAFRALIGEDRRVGHQKFTSSSPPSSIASTIPCGFWGSAAIRLLGSPG
jgi:hypothetical protein